MPNKMICLVTWTGGANYGTILQAHALAEYINEQGYNVNILKSANSWQYYFLHFSALCDRIKRKIERRKSASVEETNDEAFVDNLARIFDEFRNKYFKYLELRTFEDLHNVSKKYKTFIVGSDQVWNPYHYHPIDFLDFVNSKKAKKVSYSPSIGVTEIPTNLRMKYKHYLRDYSAIGVREYDAALALKELSPVEVTVNVDPVLLLNSEKWRIISENYPNIAIKDLKYVLCYFVGKNKQYLKFVSAVSKRMGYKILLIPMHKTDYNYQSDSITVLDNVNPNNFLALIECADYVVTDSFHASCFSIIFKKEFYVLKRFSDSDPQSENSKINNLLKWLKLDDRLVDSGKEINYNHKIDYSKVYKLLEKRINSSKEFIKRSL